MAEIWFYGFREFGEDGALLFHRENFLVIIEKVYLNYIKTVS